MIDFSNNTHTELSVYTIPQRETKKHYDNVINWRNIEQLFVFQQLALMIDFFFFFNWFVFFFRLLEEEN